MHSLCLSEHDALDRFTEMCCELVVMLLSRQMLHIMSIVHVVAFFNINVKLCYFILYFVHVRVPYICSLYLCSLHMVLSVSPYATKMYPTRQTRGVRYK